MIHLKCALKLRQAADSKILWYVWPRFSSTEAKDMSTRPSQQLETFPNPCPDRDYTVHMNVPEFTCLCPRTGQPDFANLDIECVPDETCVELKSLKLYVWSYRDQGAFHEAVTNRILDDLCAAIRPRFLRITAKFNVRGGIYTTVTAEYRKPGWEPAPRVTPP